MAVGYSRVSLESRIRDYLPYARQLPARWDELLGVAQGSGLAIENVLLMQLLEDLLEVEACTTVGRAGVLLHAEMWFASHTDYAVLISEPDFGPPVITVSCIGFLTGVGLNGSGFAMGVQSTSSRDARVGVPRAMVSRSALCARSAVDAVGQATGHHRSGGNGFVIVSPQGVQVVETSAVIHDVSAERLWGGHTNHYVSGKFDRVATSDQESAHRLEQALETVGRCQGPRDEGHWPVPGSESRLPSRQPRRQRCHRVRPARRRRARLAAHRARRGREGPVDQCRPALDRAGGPRRLCDQSGRISTYPPVPCTRIR